MGLSALTVFLKATFLFHFVDPCHCVYVLDVHTYVFKMHENLTFPVKAFSPFSIHCESNVMLLEWGNFLYNLYLRESYLPKKIEVHYYSWQNKRKKTWNLSSLCEIIWFWKQEYVKIVSYFGEMLLTNFPFNVPVASSKPNLF